MAREKKKQVKHKEPKHVPKHAKADDEVKKKTTRRRSGGAPRQVSVDLGPIEPEVADVLALIDDAKGRPVAAREVEPADERGKGGAAARRGRGGRRDQRTPEQPGLSKKERASKQL